MPISKYSPIYSANNPELSRVQDNIAKSLNDLTDTVSKAVIVQNDSLITAQGLPVPSAGLVGSSLTIQTDGTYTITAENVICNKATALAITLSDGDEMQSLDIVNIGAGTATITPATSTGTNTAALVTNGFVKYKFLGGEWRAVAGAGCTLS
jgi:hypothetical protein